MRSRFWLLGALLFILAGTAAGQGTQFANDVLRNTAIIAGASVRVCVKTATGTPCTPLATIYSDEAMTSVDADSIVTADSAGRFTFYAPAGCYKLQISAAGFSTSTITECKGVGAAGRGTFDVTNYGAKGDSTNCANGTDDTAAITAAKVAAAAVGGTVFFPVGGYRITASIVHDGAAPMIFEGVFPPRDNTAAEGLRGSVLCGNIAAPLIQRSTAAPDDSPILVRNMGVVNLNAAGIGVEINQSVAPCGIENLYIRAFKGIYVQQNTFECHATNNNIDAPAGTPTGGYGIQLKAGGNWTISTNDVVGHDTGILMAGVSHRLLGGRLEVNNTALSIGGGGTACTSCVVLGVQTELNRVDVFVTNGSSFVSIKNFTSTNSTACIDFPSQGDGSRISEFNCSGDHTSRAGAPYSDPAADLFTVYDVNNAIPIVFQDVYHTGSIGGGKVAWNVNANTLARGDVTFINTTAPYPQVLKRVTGQTSDLSRWFNESDAILSFVDKDGILSLPAMNLTGDISPAQITSNQDDYNPTGLSTASVLRLTSDATRNINGLVGGADGRIITLANVGSFYIILVAEAGTSAAANRFATTVNVSLLPNGAATFLYDSTTSRWRLLGTSDARTLQGYIWDSPPPIGSGTPNTGAFSTLSASTTLTGAKYATTTNCASSAGTCGSAAAGAVTIAAAASTVTVSTTAVNAASRIFIFENSTLGTELSVTCNTTVARTYAVTTVTAATSFVITASAAPVTNPACLTYLIVN